MPAGRAGTYADSINRYKQYAEAMKEPAPAKTKTPVKAPVKKTRPVSRVVTPEELMGEKKSK